MLAAVAILCASTVLAASHRHATPHCTHGVSSIGPLIVRNGKVVGGDTTPHTEACLP